MFAFIEYSYFNMATNLLSVILYINMLGAMPEQSTYLVSSAFGLVCNARAFLIAHRLYKKQQEEK